VIILQLRINGRAGHRTLSIPDKAEVIIGSENKHLDYNFWKDKHEQRQITKSGTNT
jgi:hypothetical protein